MDQILGMAWGQPGNSTTTASSSPYTYINGYPTIEGNYFDCYGNIDNDMAHHTLNTNDTDPAHHSGKNCPGGAPLPPNTTPNPMWMMGNTGNPWTLSGWWNSFQNQFHWTIIPVHRMDFQGILDVFTQAGM